MMKRLIATGALLLSAAAWCQPPPDTVLVNGKICQLNDRFTTAEALAIRGGRIARLGTTSEIRKSAGPATRVIDLQGCTVIPGLIDSDMHALRAGLSFATEVNWVGARSLAEALGRIREAPARGGRARG